MALDAITLRAVIKELQPLLIGGKIDKISQPEQDELIFTVRKNRVNHRLLISASSSNARIHLLDDLKKENPLHAPMFLMLLRKHLGNATVLSFDQRGNERIVEIVTEGYDELRILKKKLLIVELMGKHSNIILLDPEDRKIIDSIKRVSLNVSSIREVLPGLTYSYPPTKDKVNPLHNLNQDNFTSLFQTATSQVYQFFYQFYEGLSPTIGKELCSRSGIDPSELAKSLSSTKIERLWGSFERLMDSVSQHRYSPCIATESKPYRIVDFSAVHLTQYEENNLLLLSSANEACRQYYELKDKTERIHQKTASLRKRVQTRLDMLKHKTEKQNGELSSSLALDKDRHYGELLTSYVYLMKKGMKEITVEDFYNENRPLTIPLDINKTPSENIQRYFKRYQKSKNRIQELTVQIAHSNEEIEYLENVLFSISQLENLSDIKEIQEELYTEGYIRRPTEKKPKKIDLQSKPMEFVSTDGTLIYVGKNNMQNDRLTLELSSPHDIWLHTKDIHGSHVIVKSKLSDVSKKTLEEAAQLAAFYSKARYSAQVPVDYTERKHVKKPNGAKPGMVIYEKNSTLYVTPQEELIDSLKIKPEKGQKIR